MWTETDSYLENCMKNRQEQEKEIRTRLGDIYDNGNDDIKLIISMLIQTEYSLAIEKDNYISREISLNAQKNNETPNYSRANNVKKYEEENNDLIKKVW